MCGSALVLAMGGVINMDDVPRPNTDPWAAAIEDARLFYLTRIDDELIVNLQTDVGFQRTRINHDQLAGLVLEGVRILLTEKMKVAK